MKKKQFGAGIDAIFGNAFEPELEKPTLKNDKSQKKIKEAKASAIKPVKSVQDRTSKLEKREVTTEDAEEIRQVVEKEKPSHDRKIRANFAFEHEFIEKLKAVAYWERRTMTDIIECMVQNYFDSLGDTVLQKAIDTHNARKK